MTAFEGLPARPPVLRLCMRHVDVPHDACHAHDEKRCLTRECDICGARVHYDPAASIPELGPERIVCTQCLEDGKVIAYR